MVFTTHFLETVGFDGVSQFHKFSIPVNVMFQHTHCRYNCYNDESNNITKTGVSINTLRFLWNTLVETQNQSAATTSPVIEKESEND